jgi:hypothetical protein
VAITLSLVYTRPDRLRYLCDQDGVISSPPVAADGLVVLPNDAGVTPDLQTDIATAAQVAGVSGTPLRALIRAGIDGFGPIAAGGLTQAQARALFMSDDAAGAVLTNKQVLRAVCSITPRNGAGVPLGSIQWAVDVNVDGEGDPVIEVRSSVGEAAAAFLDIHLRHTHDL